MKRKYQKLPTLLMLLPAMLFAAVAPATAKSDKSRHTKSLVIKEQGSFMVGGRRLTAANGQTYPYDHLYAQYQIPENARNLPLVMVHGAGQTGKGWEATPDGREGYQSFFVRQGFAVYVVDFPRRGRAGLPSFSGPLGNFFGTQVIPDQTSRSSDQARFVGSRLGLNWLEYFPNSKFPKSGLDEFLRSSIPGVQDDTDVIVDGLVALLDRIGPAILVTHLAGRRLLVARAHQVELREGNHQL